MSAATTVPEVGSLEQARAVIEEQFHAIEQLNWRVNQLEKQIFGVSSERKTEGHLSKEQILFSLFPAPAQPAATQPVLLPPVQERGPERERRQPAAKVLETVTERIEPEEKVCPHCGKDKCEISHEKSVTLIGVGICLAVAPTSALDRAGWNDEHKPIALIPKKID